MSKTVATVGESAQALKDGVSELLAAGGPLESVRKKAGLPFAHNPEQAELARAYADIIGAPDPELERGGRIAAVAAETGTGKTAAYLSALTLNAATLGGDGVVGEKGTVSTRTRALQRQLVNPDAPMDETRLVAEATAQLLPNKPRVQFARRIGRRNYIDPDRVRRAAAELRNENPTSAATLEKIAELAAPESGVATFDELPELFSPEELRAVFPDDLCVTASSAPEAAAKHNRDAERAKEADIVVVNHALALIDARLGGGLFPQRQVAVFDEADTLPETARAMADERVSLETVRLSLAAVPDSDSATAAANRLQRAARDALKNGIVVVKPQHAKLIEAVRELSASAKTAALAVKNDRDLRDTLRAAALSLRHWAENAAEPKRGIRSVLVPAPDRKSPAFHIRNNAPAFVLSRLWKARDDGLPLYRAVVFTSATLSPFGELTDHPDESPILFRPFLREMGIGAGAKKDRRSDIRPDNARAFAPEQFGEMKIILADPQAPSAKPADNDPAFAEYAAAAIRKAQTQGGRVLVLVPSFAFAEALGEKIPDTLTHKSGEPLAPLLEKYRADPSAVLITPSAWEGVDLPGPRRPPRRPPHPVRPVG